MHAWTSEDMHIHKHDCSLIFTILESTDRHIWTHVADVGSKDLNKSTQYSSRSTSAKQYYSVGEEFMTSGTKFGMSYRVERQLHVTVKGPSIHQC